jgi:hypothetical protein
MDYDDASDHAATLRDSAGARAQLSHAASQLSDG